MREISQITQKQDPKKRQKRRTVKHENGDKIITIHGKEKKEKIEKFKKKVTTFDENGNKVVTLDTDKNGKPDAILTYEGKSRKLMSKSVFTYTHDKNGNKVITESVFDKDDSLLCIKETGLGYIKFDDNADFNYELMERYYSDGSIKERNFDKDASGKYEITRKFHSNGKVSEFSIDENEDGKPERVEIYDENGKFKELKRDENNNGNFEKLAVFDTKGNTIKDFLDKNDNGFYEDKIYIDKNNGTRKREYDLNEDGFNERVEIHKESIVEVSIDTVGDQKYDKVEVYNKDDKTLTFVKYDNDGDKKYEEIETYHKNGNVKEVIITDKDGKLLEKKLNKHPNGTFEKIEKYYTKEDWENYHQEQREKRAEDYENSKLIYRYSEATYNNRSFNIKRIKGLSKNLYNHWERSGDLAQLMRVFNITLDDIKTPDFKPVLKEVLINKDGNETYEVKQEFDIKGDLITQPVKKKTTIKNRNEAYKVKKESNTGNKTTEKKTFKHLQLVDEYYQDIFRAWNIDKKAGISKSEVEALIKKHIEIISTTLQRTSTNLDSVTKILRSYDKNGNGIETSEIEQLCKDYNETIDILNKEASTRRMTKQEREMMAVLDILNKVTTAKDR